jgi:pilus assembly protein Flp/PilA
MCKVKSLVADFVRSEDGPVATEYAVMLALVIVVALGSITRLGDAVDQVFNYVATAVEGVDVGAP